METVKKDMIITGHEIVRFFLIVAKYGIFFLVVCQSSMLQDETDTYKLVCTTDFHHCEFACKVNNRIQNKCKKELNLKTCLIMLLMLITWQHIRAVLSCFM